jgi:TolB-like protein
LPLSSGRRLGPYEILSPLGAGGMGEVYRARDTRLDREVAIKVLPECLSEDAGALSRFEREAKVLAALSHPNVLSIHDFGREDTVAFAVMELLEGQTLRARVAPSALPWREAAEIGAAVADGLAAAHSRGVIHRDLKPENIFITSEGTVKILDFGLARREPMVRSGLESHSPTVTQQTVPGTLMGTAGYMAPEQVSGAPGDARSDIFSLGCVLYEMVSGRRAFPGRTAAESIVAIVRDIPLDLSASAPGIPIPLDQVVVRCLEKDPERRFQSARDLAFALRGIGRESGIRAQPAFRGRGRFVATAALVLAGLGALFALDVGGLRSRLVGRGASRIESLAVLPLQNLSANPEQDYFVDGVTEALIGDLAKISSLRVISRTSAMAYKGTKKTLPQIARELNVDAVVEGSVTRSGNRVRISAQLIQASTDAHLWADTFEREARDVLGLQGEIAQTIARQIEAKLTPEERARLSAARPVDPQAHEAYLKGRYYWNMRPVNNAKAIEYFQKAIEIDPVYAEPYAGLADTYVTLGSWENGSLPPKEAFTKGKAAATKALEIDPNLSEAHNSLAYAHLHYDWDWTASEQEFKRSLELNPGYTPAMHWYSHLLTAMGRMNESLAMAQKGLQLSPLDANLNFHLAWAYYFARQPDLCIAQSRKGIELVMHPFWNHFFLGWGYEQKGMYPQAIQALEDSVNRSKQSPVTIWALGHAYAVAGRTADANRLLETLIEQSRKAYVPPYEIGMVYLGLGQKDRTFEWFAKAFEERSGWMAYLKVDPRLDPVRSDPRFADLLRRVGHTS